MSKELPIGPYTRRILRWYDRATLQDRESGTRWYMDARTFTEELSRDTPYTALQVAGVVAVLSPQVSWDLNMEGAREAVHAHLTDQRVFTYSGYTINALKALRILSGDMTAIRGPKVEAFYAAIIGDMSSVTIDAWMIRAMRPHRENIAKVFRADEMAGAKERRAMVEATRRAARARGVEPAVLQAIAWTCVRRENPYPAPMGDDASAKKWYARQIRARGALNLTLHTRDYAWGGAPRGQAAFVAAADRFEAAGIY